MLVAASTESFSDLSVEDAIRRIMELEYTCVEIAIDENRARLKPSQVAEDLSAAVDLCRGAHRATIVAYRVNITAEGDEHYRQFLSCCRLARATKVVTISVPSAELGTPFNQEVEHLDRLVSLATQEGVRVAIESRVGHLSGDPDTVTVLCDNVQGLGLTLDPTHYLCHPDGPKKYDNILKYTYHVHLRDSTRTQLQVRIGQGEIEYGRLVNVLTKQKYNRALTVDLVAMEGVDHMAEMRKMRLLLESLL